jgi:hypothetical protein
MPLGMTTSQWLARLLALVLAAAGALLAQCPNQGSLPRFAHVERAPFALGCAAAPEWPAWHLRTPAHRAPAMRTGFQPGGARALPVTLQTWQCTGLLLPAILPASLLTMGYVLDRAEYACVAPH